ncbi:MAG: exonuclease SbcCD subunit D [Verrucomicrobia bacterium]|nr:exonuclease SbcCD subunit D [Verrucomicrobiota bacterium]
MKLIHLSDLHIGKRVNEVPMIEDQKYVLNQILNIIEHEKPDAVLIAGDVYDKSVPSTEAVELLDNFLCRLAKISNAVMVISGNHDSPERLAFGSRLMKGAKVHLAPVYNGKVEPICLPDAWGNVCFYLLPFIKPIHVKRWYSDEKVESYTDACKVAVANMNVDESCRNVLLTHQFVTGASTCESEEISVGGSDNVDASVFDAFDYVALGHIHGPQNIGSNNKLRYCGSPLKYSFSEAEHIKSVTIVNLGAKGELNLHAVPLKPRHDMRSVRGSFSDVMEHRVDVGMDKDDYVHVILTDEEDIPEAIGKLRLVYPNIMKLTYDNTRTRTNHVIDAAQDIQEKSPLELFDELYKQQNNQPMSDEQRTFVQKMIESIWEDNK